MDINKCCSAKLVSAEEAISNIKRGSRVFLGTGCGEPQHLIHKMIHDPNMYDILIYQMLSSTLAQYIDDKDFWRRFAVKLFFVSVRMRRAAFEGKINYIPAYISEIPKLFRNNRIGLDVALVQVSPPDKFGYCSLGVSVDVTVSAIEYAKMVIAQVNPRMPRTWGDSLVHVNDIDYLVPYEEPIVEFIPDTMPKEEIAKRIGSYVSVLLEDGATIQVGFGRLPNSILKYFDHKKNLGLHTQMISDGFLPLFEKGVITNKKKTLLPGRTVTTLCMGSKKIYDFVDNNPSFYFRSSEFVNDPTQIARNDNFVSISSALEVDLTGQVCSDSLGSIFYSGIGDQADFIRGAAMSKGGFSVIALPSTAKNDTISRIVPNLSEGAGVAGLRGDVNFVVTEYGIAELHGKDIYQRVMELAQIAHPKFRESLIETARTNHYIFENQLAPPTEDLLFLEGYKTHVSLRNGKVMTIRPLLPSDEFAYRNFFYSLKEDTIYHRFFHKIKVFSHEMAQDHWATLDYRKNLSLIGLVRNKGDKEIMAIASYAEENDDTAEAAFVVRDDFQGRGVGAYLLEALELIAIENGYKAFSAIVMSDNKGMLSVFKRRYPNAKIRRENGDIAIEMDFKDPGKVTKGLNMPEYNAPVLP